MRVVPENRVTMRDTSGGSSSGENPTLPFSGGIVAVPDSDHVMDNVAIPSPCSGEEPNADVMTVLTPGGEPVGSSFPELSSEGK